jgi:hypothetical protein
VAEWREAKERDERNAAASLGASVLSTTDWLPVYTAASPLQISGFQRGREEGVTQWCCGPEEPARVKKFGSLPGPRFDTDADWKKTGRPEGPLLTS